MDSSDNALKLNVHNVYALSVRELSVAKYAHSQTTQTQYFRLDALGGGPESRYMCACVCHWSTHVMSLHTKRVRHNLCLTLDF
jgi:hypothetical protein